MATGVTTFDDSSSGLGSTVPRNDIPFSLKTSLIDDAGVRYRTFRNTLTPRWGLVWFHLACGYGALLVLAALMVAFARVSPMGILIAVLGGVAIGYTVLFLANFFHEAAHFNIAPGHARNDLLANLVLGWMLGSSIQMYRPIHFQHHRALGTTMDSETSYFDALRVRYLAAGLFGWKAVRTMRRYGRIEREQRQRADGDAGRPQAFRRLAWVGLAATCHLGTAAVLWLAFHAPVAGLAWLWGVLFVYPFFGSLRQLLEHRSKDADADVDYSRTDHGPTNRLFGDGPVASTLGSAGFNRHALHHWEPAVSYTRLRDLERYLQRTELAPAIEERQTSYADTFLALLEL